MPREEREGRKIRALVYKNFIAFAALLLIDQLLKRLFVVYHWDMAMFGSELVGLGLYRNKGIAFSLFPDWGSIAGLGGSLLLLIITVTWIVRGEKGLLGAFSLLWLGAISNGMDRVLYGFVIDYMYIRLRLFYWDTVYFNLADIYLSLGVIWVLFILFRVESESGRKRMNE